MKRILAALAASLLSLPVFAQGNSPLRAELAGYEEAPAVNTRAFGFFEARVAKDGASVDFTLAFDGLQGQVRQAHIHFAQRSVNGAIVVWSCGTSFNPGPAGTQGCPQSGLVSGTFAAVNVLASTGNNAPQQLPANALADFIAAMRAGVAYVNVHTDLSPGGELRGQIGGGQARPTDNWGQSPIELKRPIKGAGVGIAEIRSLFRIRL